MSEAGIPDDVDPDLEKARDFPADVDYVPTEQPDHEEYEPPARFASSYDDEVIELDDDQLDGDQPDDEEAAGEAPEIVEL
jgi:hypothetical protein